MKIKFIKPWGALFLLGLLPLSAQEKKPAGPTQIQVVYETFSLPRSEAARSQREAVSDEDLYARLVTGLEKGSVVQEKLLVIRSVEGRLSTVDHVSELIFPKEYDPPELPNQVGSGIAPPTYVELPQGKAPALAPDLETARRGDGWQEGTFPATPANGAALTTLKMGDSLEIEATSYGPGPGLITLTFTAVHQAPAGLDWWGQDLAKVSMPRFTQQKLESKLSLKDQQASLVGTVTPDVITEAGQKKETRIWFSFVTASFVDLEK